MQKFYFSFLLFSLISYSTCSLAIDKPVEIKGSFENCSNEKVYIKSEDFIDSFTTDKQGNFNYKTFKINRPLAAYLIIGKRLNASIYLAPGFELSMTANVENNKSFYHSLRLSGIGSATNQYWKENYFLEESWKKVPFNNEWYDLKTDVFVKEGLKSLQLDSFAVAIDKSVFGNANKDPYKNFFKNYSGVDIGFKKLCYLFAYTMWNDISIEQTGTFIKESIDPKLFYDLNHDNNLSDFFYTQTISFYYLEYLVNKEAIDHKEIQVSMVKRKLEIADSLYQGKTKDYVFNRIMDEGHAIESTFSFQELNMMKSFVKKIKNETVRNRLVKAISDRERIIDKVKNGEPAPVFNLPDTANHMHSLRDFLGKVVYIDLWASWCGPCREEMPFLKIIYNEYKKSGKLEIISIAVNDSAGKDKRNKFIQLLQPGWLLLDDQDDFVYNKYNVTFIPRFILIDRNGKILSFDAPEPSDKEKLKKMIDEAIKN